MTSPIKEKNKALLNNKKKEMKLKDYIKREIKKGKTDFNIPLDEKGEYNPKGLSKVSFKLSLNNKKK